jgi:LEA14-like dessication related protein
MKLEKKHIIAIGLGVVSIALAGAYLQYKKMMNYCLSLKMIKPKDITTKNFDADVFLNLENKSDVKLEIVSQEYNVYINNKFITRASNAIAQTISPNSTSIIGVNVRFNPEKAGENILSAILSLSKITVKIEVKLKVKFLFVTVSIPYVYESTLSELLKPSSTPSPNKNCKK